MDSIKQGFSVSNQLKLLKHDVKISDSSKKQMINISNALLLACISKRSPDFSKLRLKTKQSNFNNNLQHLLYSNLYMISPQTYKTVNNAISYFFIAVGTLFSFLTILLILLNRRSMLSNTYCRLIFIIQFLLFVACASDFPVYVGIGCKVSAALFYFFFLMSNLFTEMLMLLVLADLTRQRKKYKKKQMWLGGFVVMLSAIISFVPFQLYEQCYVGSYKLYCGYCFPKLNLGSINMLFYLIPCLIGIVFLILTCKVKIKLQQHLSHQQELNDNQKQALNVIFIPFLSILLILINFIGQCVFFGFYNFVEEDNKGLGIFIVSLNSLLFLIPMVNFVFFLRFVSRLEGIVKVKINVCRCIFGLKGKGPDGDLQQELSDL